MPHPWPLKQDDKLCEAFFVKLRAWQEDPQTDVWFSDERGLEGDPRPQRTRIICVAAMLQPCVCYREAVSRSLTRRGMGRRSRRPS